MEKAIEESFEVREAFQNDGYKEQVSEIADLINVTNKLKAYLENIHAVSSDKLELDISNIIEQKNKRTDERIISGYYDEICNMNHEHVDLSDLSPKHRDIVQQVIKMCRGTK